MFCSPGQQGRWLPLQTNKKERERGMGEGERQRDTQPWTQQSSVVDLHSNTCAQSVGGDGRWAMGDGQQKVDMMQYVPPALQLSTLPRSRRRPVTHCKYVANSRWWYGDQHYPAGTSIPAVSPSPRIDCARVADKTPSVLRHVQYSKYTTAGHVCRWSVCPS
jgi:hypothetical protein